MIDDLHTIEDELRMALRADAPALPRVVRGRILKAAAEAQFQRSQRRCLRCTFTVLLIFVALVYWNGPPSSNQLSAQPSEARASEARASEARASEARASEARASDAALCWSLTYSVDDTENGPAAISRLDDWELVEAFTQLRAVYANIIRGGK